MYMYPLTFCYLLCIIVSLDIISYHIHVHFCVISWHLICAFAAWQPTCVDNGTLLLLVLCSFSLSVLCVR